MADRSAVKIVVDTDPRRVRDERGRYTSEGVNETLLYNRAFADYLLAELGGIIEGQVSSYKRAAASTGRLVRASIDQRNSIVTKEFVGVGRPDWLDRSQAKYWRTYEEGSAFWGFAGTPLFPTGKKVPYPVAHGAHPGLRTSSIPFGLKGGGGAEDLFVVRNEIAPRNAYGELNSRNLDQIREFSVQLARRYITERLNVEVVVRGAGAVPNFSRMGKHGPRTDALGNVR